MIAPILLVAAALLCGLIAVPSAAIAIVVVTVIGVFGLVAFGTVAEVKQSLRRRKVESLVKMPLAEIAFKHAERVAPGYGPDSPHRRSIAATAEHDLASGDITDSVGHTLVALGIERDMLPRFQSPRGQPLFGKALLRIMRLCGWRSESLDFAPQEDPHTLKSKLIQIVTKPKSRRCEKLSSSPRRR